MKAVFTCEEAAGGPGLAEPAGCAGTDASGQGVNTETPGSHEFTVSATSEDGWKVLKRVNYSVYAPLSAATTICNRYLGGSGRELTVPAGARCTLAPGTKLSKNLRVQPGGTLVAEGVSIAGNLVAQDPVALQLGGGHANTVAGNLQVVGLSGSSGANLICNTRVGANLLVSGSSSHAGPIELGGDGAGPDCAPDSVRLNVNVSANADTVEVLGDRLEGEVLLSDDSGPVAVEGDVIGGSLGIAGDKGPTSAREDRIAHNLCAQRDSGALSLEEDSLGANLTIRSNSGGVVVSHDEVGGRGECAANKPPASGTGNTFKGLNEGCPAS